MRRWLWVMIVPLCAAASLASAREVLPRQARKSRSQVAVVRAIVPLIRAWYAPHVDEERVRALLEHYRPLVLAELELVRQSCELAPQERPRIKAAAEACVRRTILHSGKLPMDDPFADAPMPSEAELRTRLRKAVAGTLSAEQAASYKRRLDERTARRKRAAILLAVARLDAALYLTAEQRDKIGADLAKSADTDWDSWLSIGEVDGNYIPEVNDGRVVPHLRPEQAAVYSGLEKVSFGVDDAASGNQGAELAEDEAWWRGKPAAQVEAARPPAAP